MKKTYNLSIIISTSAVLVFFLIILIGCGVSASLESAKNAVDDARSAVMSAKEAKAETYSPKNMKAAERFLNEAEQALSSNRRQRAYILANKAKNTAESAKAEARGKMEFPKEAPIVSEMAIQPQPTAIKQPAVIPPDIVIPKGIEQDVAKKPFPTAPSINQQSEFQTLDMQNRIQAAAQALDAAQKAVESARLLLFKLQVDVELSKMDSNIKLLQDSNAPMEMINLIKTWYNQAQQIATMGNYDVSMKIIQRIQTYMQVLTSPIQ
ncbi:MAG: DUF4398 domain-containing protein [Candidatus Poribacteria bacterium]